MASDEHQPSVSDRTSGGRWSLTPEAFAGLMEQLGSNPAAAAEKYEKVRTRLSLFFKYRGCQNPEEYVDETIDRVARRLSEGATLRVEDPYLYFHGVAINVLREYHRHAERKVAAIEDLPVHEAPRIRPVDLDREREERDERERRLECLESCLEALPSRDADLVAEYYHGDGKNKDRRKHLADERGISANSLKIRVFRIKSRLLECVETCLGRSAAR